jgi:pyruvate dehydrogenase E1 component beta subunit
MADVSLIDALTMAMAWELEHDSRVVVLGEDVGVNGGVFRATAGLQKRFGADRVQDTPLAEGMIAGISIGMAVQGMLPVAEIQFMGFIYPTVDQMISHAGRMRNRTRGRLSCPMVLRAPYGGGIHAPEHHSESTEAFFAHMPGIRVVIPSSPARAYGLLPQSGPGRVSGAEKNISIEQAERRRQRQGAAAGRLLYIARRQRRYARHLGRDDL